LCGGFPDTANHNLGLALHGRGKRIVILGKGPMMNRVSVILATLTVFFSAAALSQTAPGPPAFEAASVRLSKDVRVSPSIGPSPGGERFAARNMPLLWLIATAHGVSIRQVSGLPETFPYKSYDIQAKSTQPASREQMMRMLQSLLEDRFKLRLHRQSKDLTVYVLRAGKGGPKLEENRDGAELEARKTSGSKSTYRNFPMSLFANILSGAVDDTVVDQTGLTGSYDFTFEYTPERVGQGVKDGREPAPNPDGPSIFTALQEQLGLKLESEKTTVEFLVVDHIEEPTVD
jgi:uncharacterized protein (TIGR03435 family)